LLERQLVDAGLTALAELRAVVERIVVREGSITLGRLRDEHVTSRRPARRPTPARRSPRHPADPGMIVGFCVAGNGRFPGRARGCANV